jgi:hypothetical protein
MSQKLKSAIAVIGIDIGKNSFHVVGHDECGAIVLGADLLFVKAQHRGHRMLSSTRRQAGPSLTTGTLEEAAYGYPRHRTGQDTG